MTITQQLFIDRVKQYMENKNDIAYRNVCNRMVRDKQYEKFIIAMTIDQINPFSDRGVDKKFQYRW